MVETRSGVAIEPEHAPVAGKTYKETAETSRGTTGLTARAGGIRAPAFRGWYGLTTAQAYTMLALGHLSLAIPLIFGWRQTAKAVFGKSADPPEDQHANLLHLYASSLCSSAAIAFALEELARRRMLHSYTADILKMGLVGHGISWMALFLYYPATMTLPAMLVEGVASLATAALPASQMLNTRADRNRVWRDIQAAPRHLKTFFPSRHQGRFRWLASLYALLTLVIPIAGAAYFIAPRFTLFHTFGYDYGRSTQMLWKAIGAGGAMTIMPALTAALKHKADIDMMAATPARTLNLGLMGTAVGHLLVLGPVFAKAHGGFLMPAIIGTWGLALLTSMLGLAAPEAAQLAEQVAEEAAKTQ